MTKIKFFLKNNIKCFKFIAIFIFCFIFCFCYTNFLLVLDNDEVWNYGFSYNISQGLVPYRDFNVIQTPLYFFCGSFFIKIFGNFLFSLHIFDALIVALIVLLLFKLIGRSSFGVFLLIVVYCLPSYNLLSIFWLILLIYLIEKKRDTDFWIGIIVGLAFLTKQNVGVCLFFPMLFYSKDKFKVFLSFLTPIFVFFIYLVVNNAFFDFINCCFFGLFDFGAKNGYVDGLLIFLEVIIVAYLLSKLLKSKFSDKIACYVLFFQIMLYPIANIQHFLMVFSPFVLYIFLREKFDRFVKLIIMVSISLYFLLYIAIFANGWDVNLEANFMYLRKGNFNEWLSAEKQLIQEYTEGVDYYFLIVDNAYLRKLYMGVSIGRYDFMLNGNMGYQGGAGGKKFVNEIDNICSKNSCVFFVDESIYNEGYSQFNKEIYNYVVNNYKRCAFERYFSVFKN